MLSTVLDYASNPFVVGAVSLVTGVVSSQKIKDWISGVPSELRVALSSLESQTKQQIASATSDVIAKVSPAMPVAPVAPAPAAPAAPAHPAA